MDQRRDHPMEQEPLAARGADMLDDPVFESIMEQIERAIGRRRRTEHRATIVGRDAAKRRANRAANRRARAARRRNRA